jgi:tetratricopeptide (TPR) repeat protein
MVKAIYLPLFMVLFNSTAAASGSLSHEPRPVADSILQKQRDSILFQLNLDYLNGVNENRTPFELISIIQEILELDPALYNQWFNLGIEQLKIHEYDMAIASLERGLELRPGEGNPALIQIYISLSYCYHQTDRHQREKEWLELASSVEPEHPGILGRYLICAHSRMRNTEAAYYLDKLVSVLRSREMILPEIEFHLGKLYLTTDYLEAEKHLRIACQYDPDDLEKLGTLAWVLIRNSLKIDEGMDLIEKAIKADPGNAVYIHQQGYGYYSKGDYEDALFNLYTARDLYGEYSFELEKHIDMVEEAILSRAKEGIR